MVTLVTNIPSPYREPVYTRVEKMLGNGGFNVIYCQKKESDREWDIIEGGYGRFFLKERVFKYRNQVLRHVHFNPEVWSVLNSLDPNMVITNGYNPTHLLAFLWCIFKRKKHIAMTDGWLTFESNLTIFHRIIRRIVLRRSSAFIGASEASLELFKAYGALPGACFRSHLCADNESFDGRKGYSERTYDIMYCGQLTKTKNMAFFGKVCIELSKTKRDIRILICGNGPERDSLLRELQKGGVEYFYPGFVSTEQLPSYYESARILLFPTLIECWGVVVNEACAAGTVVVSSKFTAAVPELIENKITGFVCDLDLNDWVSTCISILSSPSQWEQISNKARKRVLLYNYEDAAKGMVDAVYYAKCVKQ